MAPTRNTDPDSPDGRLKAWGNGRLMGMRSNRYSWWTHWRELADFFLPRRYRWLITPNMQSRGSPINQHIIDSTGVIAARNCAAGFMSGKTPPSRPWFKLKIGRIDSTQTSPVSLWLAECERKMAAVFHESNYYNSMAVFFFDLVIFGTAVKIIYEDFDNVIKCYNPCAGEYYVDINGDYRPCILYMEYTMTIGALVDDFGIDNVSTNVRQMYENRDGSSTTREIVVAHAIEPNNDGRAKQFGISERFAYREFVWEWGGSNNPQAGQPPGFLRKGGFYEQPQSVGRWDTVSNDPYGRSPAMDALGDQKQLQQETRRKAQAIDKMVNPPLVADVQLKNQPASLLPGGITYVSGYTQSGKPGFSSVYDTKFPVNEITEDLNEVRERIKKIFFNDLFQPLTQYETRSNITAVEIDQRKAESLIMLGPVFDRLDNEVLAVDIERTFAIMSRAGILPEAPEEIQGQELTVEFSSMLALAQEAQGATVIERVLAMAGNLAGVDPAVMDNIDVDFAVDKYAHLLNTDPRMIRSPEALAEIRAQRQQQQAAAQQAEIAEKLAAGAKNLAAADVSQPNMLTALMGGQ